MPNYAVIGASRGTGLAIVKQLAGSGKAVRAIARTPPPASINVEPFVADVTDKSSIARALIGQFTAIFFTVDITGGIGDHALFGPAEKIREVTYLGCLNAIEAVSRKTPPQAFVLLSVIGSDQSSFVWTMLNTAKPGSKRNIREREIALKGSGVPYVIVRAPKLSDGPGGQTPLAATQPIHKLVFSMSITRTDLATAMIRAGDHGPKNSTWDVFSDVKGPAPFWLTQS